MSDLSRLRRRLAEIERSGKRLKAEKAQLAEEIAADPAAYTRSSERRTLYLDKLIEQRRKDWRAVHDALAVEKKRLLADPAAMLRFT